ncbi:MAG: bifunctional hydroxymethylpyrimidine kinase/phosphomethylpyrimidine kinase [Thermoplasmata archaeon]|nr:bifunctional hydroxymethylpyrimidine kinase/phosphomethylpyrimidine kinase [Thermoplasmata archaeon]
MAKALTIAGSDSGGGAGIQADLKTFASFGVHGMSAITSITAQNTVGVEAIFDLPPWLVKKQIECLAEDIGIDAAKTGMLSNKEIVRGVANTLKKYDFPVVVDPVMIAKSGAYLLKEDAIDAFIKYILPIAFVITPNKHEAERLSGIKIKNREDAKKAAKEIKKLGAEAVIIKGGHMQVATDLLYYKGKFIEYKGKKIKGCTHGTGCSFSAAITANLAKGLELEKAIFIAKKFITMAIQYGEKIGHGHCPVNPLAYMAKNAEKWKVYEELYEAVEELKKKNIVDFIPEVGMNFAYALPMPYAKSIDDVLGIEGRIVRAGKKAKAGEIKSGASRHLAKAILKAMEFDSNVRAVMNIKYDEDVLKRLRRRFSVSFYDRQEEPEEIKKKEGATIPWGIENAIRRAGKIPDIIYHKGDVGKEPMILIFGKNPKDVLRKFDEIRKM